MADISIDEAPIIDFQVVESSSEDDVVMTNVGASVEEKAVVGVKRRRRGPMIKNPLKCRACGKLFTDTSNRRRHEKDRVCCRSKPSDGIKKCITNNYESLNTHINKAYDDISKKMVSVLGAEIYERNSFSLIDSSLFTMRRTLLSERSYLISSLKAVEKMEMKNASGEKQNMQCK